MVASTDIDLGYVGTLLCSVQEKINILITIEGETHGKSRLQFGWFR